MTAPGRSARLHPDRRAAPAWTVPVLALAAAAAMGASGYLVSSRGSAPVAGMALAAVAGALAVAALPSLSPRTTSRAAVALSGVALVRFGVLAGEAGTSLAIGAIWLVAVVTVLVVSHHLPPSSALAPGGRPPRAAPVAGVVGRVAAISGLLLVVLVLAAPGVASRLGDGSAVGDDARLPDGDEADPLTTTERLDMTTRPRLSDRIVMRVRADQATFWRQDTYDQWDGRTWTRSQGRVQPVGADGRVDAPDHDLGRDGSDVITQRFELEVPAALSLPAAPTAAQVEASARLFQREDGSLLVDPVLGAGAVYTVQSRRVPTSEADLRAAEGEVPPDVATRFATPPVTTARVRAAARDVTAGISSTYDRVRALEAWMGGRAEYSLDAPLAPEGVDVVDHFLFTAREGWCEQIASSLVVLARSVGIPARLAVGYVPGERDPLTGELVVRERQAHAWAEVWFPDVGWVPFDPTAQVPLAGEDDVDTWADLARRSGPRLVAVALLVVVLGVVGRALVRRVRARSGPRHLSPVGLVERDLDALGASIGRPRAPAETATAYSGALAALLGVDELALVGAVVDDAVFAPIPPSPDDLAAARRALARAAVASTQRTTEPAPSG